MIARRQAGLPSSVRILHEIRRRASRAVLALALAAPCAGALADGLVVESDAIGYAVGDVVKAGEDIRLEAGERLVILDQSGEVAAIETSGPYRIADMAQAGEEIGALGVLDTAFDPGRRADIGGTRAEDEQACRAAAAERGDLYADHCARARPEAAPAPALDIAIALRAGAVQPADPLMFKLEATFDSIALCAASEAADGAQSYPLDLSAEHGALRLMDGVPAMAPRRGSPRLVAPDTPGDYQVDCIAVDPDTWAAFAPRLASDGVVR